MLTAVVVLSGCASAKPEQGAVDNTSLNDLGAAALLQKISSLSKSGKVLGCDFAAGSTVIGDVEDAWGKADSSQYVAKAKGTYNAYNSRHIVMGIGKGELVYEIRNSDPALAQITRDDVLNLFGKAEYTADGHTIVGYTVNNDLKLKFVFQSANKEATLDHYMVLYPAGTANSMADDRGRAW
ncbi:YjgB family protein [Desulfovibrio sp. OttesenSCG-928-G15]|nr:YjgB family protein [Desulfovibrio sp. OttesenSCG-928-G15]